MSVTCETCPVTGCCDSECWAVDKWIEDHDKDLTNKILQAVIDSGWHCEVHSPELLFEMVKEEMKNGNDGN